MGKTVEENPTADGAPKGPRPPDESFEDLFQRAEAGDESVLPALRKALDERPEVWRRRGDLGAQALVAWVALAAGPKLGTSECIRRRAAALQRELGGTECSPLEAVLVQQAVIAWVQTSFAHMSYLNVGHKNPTLELLAAAEQRQAAAQRRLLAVVKELAVVRKLLKPAPSTLDLLTRASPEQKPTFGGRMGKKERLPVGAN